MSTIFKDGVVHAFSHINEEKRAGRTWCGRYVEFWAHDLCDDTVPVSCLTCLSQPQLTVEEWRNAHRDIDERGDDIAMRCGTKHRERVDEHDRCTWCGYRQVLQFYDRMS